MANIIKTRILLRNDTLANWEESTLSLAKGEVAIATVGGNLAEVRVGDGANGTTWANSLKLRVDASQVSGIVDLIQGTAKKYQVVSVDTNSWKLQEAALSGGEWTDLSTWSVDFSSINDQITALTADVDFLSGAIDTVSGAVDVVSGALDDYMTLTAFNAISTEIGLDAASSTNKVATMSDISALDNVMHFKGVVNAKPTATTGYDVGDVVIVVSEDDDNGKEFVLVNTGTASDPVYAWEQIGDQNGISALTEYVDTLVATVSADTLDAAKDYTDAEIGKLSTDYGFALSADVDALVADVSADTLDAAKSYTDDELAKLSTDYGFALSADVDSLVATVSAATLTAANEYTDTAVGTAISALDVSDSENGNADAGFVQKVTETDGKVSVVKKTLQLSDITDVADISANIGLSDYALSADVTTLVSTTSAELSTALVGESTDDASADTVYGAKAYADAKVDELSSGFLILDCGNSGIRTDEPTPPFSA